MRAIALVAFICLLVVPAVVAEQTAFKIHCNVYRLNAQEILGPSLSHEVWHASQKSWGEIEKSVAIFEKAQFRFGENVLRLDEPRIYWNDKLLTMDDSGSFPAIRNDALRLIYSTEVNLTPGKRGNVFLAARQPFQYFERRKDGLFELKEIELPAGLDLQIRAREAPDKYVLLDDVTIKVRAVTERQNIPGVVMPVGRPILKTDNFKLSLKLKHKNTYWIQVKPQNADGSLLISINARYE